MRDILIGMAVGDAVGVPYEFKSREEMEKSPCTDMIGYGTHRQPIGTWSDDSSMAFCMVESLIRDCDMRDMGNTFVNWFRNGYWTTHGRVFDMGGTTQMGLLKVEKGLLPANCCGNADWNSNGNGSVMRILPIVPYFIDNGIENSVHRFKMIADASSITHRHIISVMSCFILTEIARYIVKNRGGDGEKMVIINKNALIKQAITNFLLEYNSIKHLIHHNPNIMAQFAKLFNENLENTDISKLSGDGFCINTLISSIWCVLTTDSYKDAVLKAVNLGEDTDTTACVTGGLASLIYGYDGIPLDWRQSLVKHDDIVDLAVRYDNSNLFCD